MKKWENDRCNLLCSGFRAGYHFLSSGSCAGKVREVGASPAFAVNVHCDSDTATKDAYDGVHMDPERVQQESPGRKPWVSRKSTGSAL